MGSDQVEPYEGGFYGVVGMFAGWGPRMAADLLEQDRRRQQTLFTLATHFPQAFAGVNRAFEISSQAVDFVRDSDFPPLGDLVRRTSSNLRISFDGVLSGRESVVMDTCRDQMEIAALAQEFLHQPQRIPKWMSGKDRSREFGFKRLIEKYDTELLILPTGGREELLREYAAHSEGLHPRADEVNPVTLSKAPVEPRYEWWLPVAMREILHHVHATLVQLDVALGFHLKLDEWPLGVIEAGDDDALLIAIQFLGDVQARMAEQTRDHGPRNRRVHKRHTSKAFLQNSHSRVPTSLRSRSIWRLYR